MHPVGHPTTGPWTSSCEVKAERLSQPIAVHAQVPSGKRVATDTHRKAPRGIPTAPPSSSEPHVNIHTPRLFIRHRALSREAGLVCLSLRAGT